MLKFCLCTKKTNQKDYDALPYHSENPKANITETLKQQIEQNLSKLRDLNTMKLDISRVQTSALKDFPEFQSTKVEEKTQTNVKEIDFEVTSYLQVTSKRPVVSKYASYESTEFSNDSMFTASTNSDLSIDDLAQFGASANIHVCNSAYEAQFEGDISLKYTERVEVLYFNDDFSLVKNIATNVRGYVPSSILIPFSKFINNVDFV